jgi:Protein of unknown function (DUF2868)
MALTEAQARQVTLVRLLEQTPDNGGLWTAGDAKEATRAAKALVGPQASFATFLARRAEWALEEIDRRKPGQAITFKEPRWPALAGLLLAVSGLLAGFATDYLASEQRINLIELPLLVLIVWNLAIFGLLLLGWLLSLVRQRAAPGPVVAQIGRWRIHESLVIQGKPRPWIDAFKKRWSDLAAPLNAARLKLALNVGAMLFALGALASLFVRGIGHEYRAGWETTYSFVDAQLIHAVVSWLLAPGALLLGVPIPDAQHIATLRMPPGEGEVAQTWIFLYCASVLVWIVAPRVWLIALHTLTRMRLRRAFPLPMKSAYFTIMRAAWRGQRIAVVAAPFRYELAAELRDHLARMLERIYGLAVDIAIESPVLMGEDRTDWKRVVNPDGHVAVIVVFSLAATAEAHAHGKLLDHLRSSIDRGVALVPLVDTGTYSQDDIERFRQRCNQWRQMLDKLKFTPVFIDLHKAGDDDLHALQALLNQHD